MIPKETFKLPQSVVEALGEQYAGEYVVHELDACEYIQAQTEATSFMAAKFAAENMGKPEAEQTQWNGIIPEDVMLKFIVCKSVTHNGKPIDPSMHMPAKLWEILSWKSRPLNTLSAAEFKTLFLSSQANSNATSLT